MSVWNMLTKKRDFDRILYMGLKEKLQFNIFKKIAATRSLPLSHPA